jgi:putative membrane-bound dehydrogenase-like protein
MKLHRAVVLVGLGLWGLVPRLALAADPPIPPGIPAPIPPQEAKKTFKLADGLDIQLVAHEPMVMQPLAISFDDRGRLWVLEYLQYPLPEGLKPVEIDQYLRTKYDRVPEPPPEGPRGADRIVILDDPDENGIYRKSKTFHMGWNLASGMVPGYDGVYVAQPPYLLYYPDKNHDDVPDGPPEILLKGFGLDDPHSLANSLTWGPDGWLYGAQGSTATADIRGIGFQQGVWRYHPRTKEFELFAEGGGNTSGIDFDRHGQLFAGGNTSEPLCHHVQGGYYLKGFSKHGPLHNPYTFGYIYAVQHKGFLGSALTGGFVIYQGGLLPERFNNRDLYSNMRVNAMRVSQLVPVGSTFETHFQEDLLTSTDRWFRPVKAHTGPDGAVYICDWYDYNISHSDPKDRSRYYIPSRETGRIWRVVAKEKPLPQARPWPIDKLSSVELVGLLKHPNEWYARQARRILMERRDSSIVPTLEKMVLKETDDRFALEALWALYVSGGFNDDLAMKLLDHPVDHVRAWTVRLLGDARQVSSMFNDRLVELAQQEPSAIVRNQLACTCKRLPGPVALPIVAQLLGRVEDVNDIQIPLLLWWAIEDKAISDRAEVLKLVDTPQAWNRPITRSLIPLGGGYRDNSAQTIPDRLARRYLAEGKPEDYATCAQILAWAPTSEDRERVLKAMELQMEGKSLDKAPPALAKALEPLLSAPQPSSVLLQLALRLGVEGAYSPAATRSVDPKVSETERADLIKTLGELHRPASLPSLTTLIESKQPSSVRTAALLALQRYDAPAIAEAILKQYDSMPSSLKDKARDVLVSRPAWTGSMLAAVEKTTLPSKDFSLEQVRRIVLHKDSQLTERAEKLWGHVRPATSREKTGRIAAVSQILAKGKGDVARGKPLVTKLCLNCHQLFGEGEKVGPDLSGVDRRNLDVLLQNVIDPSAIIREGYQQWVVSTTDGRILSGLLTESGPDSVVVTDAKAVRTPLQTKEIEAKKPADSSVMPEGVLDPLSDQELCDFFAYLRSDPAQPTASK